MEQGKFNKGSVFYMIQVLPRDERRFKFGYSSRIQDRLSQHKNIAPDCLVIRKYRCHPENEYFVLDIISGMAGILMISREVADVSDYKELIKYLDMLFASNDMTKPQTDQTIIFSNIVKYRIKQEAN